MAEHVLQQSYSDHMESELNVVYAVVPRGDKPFSSIGTAEVS
jgi:hypothetical protein